MRQVRLAHIPFAVSLIGFGTASLHHLWRSSSRQRLMSTAVDEGVTHFDTAPLYGYGLAEYELGRFLRGRANLTVATKFGLAPPVEDLQGGLSVRLAKLMGLVVPRWSQPRSEWDRDLADSRLAESLSRLGRREIDLLLLHEPDVRVADLDSMAEWLERAQTSGRIRAWGVAGERTRCEEVVRAGSAVASVLQVGVLPVGSDVEPIRCGGRRPQFTYGHFRGAQIGGTAELAIRTAQAIRRADGGVVLVSSRSVDRFRQLARSFVAKDGTT